MEDQKQVDEFAVTEELSVDISQSYYLFVKDTSVLAQIEAGEGEIYGDHMSLAMEYYGFDLDCSDEEQLEIYQEMNDRISGLAQTKDNAADESLPAVRIDSRANDSSGYYGMTGGLFFPWNPAGSGFPFRNRADHVLQADLGRV